MSIKLSIIVPVYNTEKYLDRCLTSLRKQTYKNLEFIIVNDGSTDNSIEICRRYAEMDSRFKVFSKTNGGLSDARNFGLQRVSGEYIGFVDSDDFISENMYEILIKEMEKYKGDIAVSSIQHVDDNEKYTNLRRLPAEITVLNKGEAFEELLFSQRISNSVCNKIFKKNLFMSIRFPKGKLYEDEYVTYRLFDLSSSAVICSNAYYYYRSNPNSITHSKFSEREFDRIIASEEKVEFCRENYPQYTHLAIKYLVYDCIVTLSKMDKYDKKYDQYILANIRKYLFVFLFGKNSLKGKIFAVLAVINPRIAIIISNLQDVK